MTINFVKDFEGTTMNTGGGCWVDYFSFEVVTTDGETRYLGVGVSDECVTWNSQLGLIPGVDNHQVAEWLYDYDYENTQKTFSFGGTCTDTFNLTSEASHFAVKDVYIHCKASVVFRLKNDVCFEILLGQAVTDEPYARLIDWVAFRDSGETNLITQEDSQPTNKDLLKRELDFFRNLEGEVRARGIALVRKFSTDGPNRRDVPTELGDCAEKIDHLAETIEQTIFDLMDLVGDDQ